MNAAFTSYEEGCRAGVRVTGGPIKLGLVFTGFLTTAHRLLNQAKRVQAEQVTGFAASTRPGRSADAELLRG